jgi:hypothetical protein
MSYSQLSSMSSIRLIVSRLVFLVNSSSTDCQIPSSWRHIRVKTVTGVPLNDCQQARIMREDDPIANSENSRECKIANLSNDRTADDNEASK